MICYDGMGVNNDACNFLAYRDWQAIKEIENKTDVNITISPTTSDPRNRKRREREQREIGFQGEKKSIEVAKALVLDSWKNLRNVSRRC